MLKYGIMMGIRVICLIVVFFLPGWWKVVPALGAVFLPYFAVVVANVGSDRAIEAVERPGTVQPYRDGPGFDGTPGSWDDEPEDGAESGDDAEPEDDAEPADGTGPADGAEPEHGARPDDTRPASGAEADDSSWSAADQDRGDTPNRPAA